MAKLPHIPANLGNGAPRCPLCGILLDARLELDSPWAEGKALFTLSPKSAAHVTKPHTMDIPKDGE